MGQTILKQTANKIRRLYKDQVLAGFAGATSDAFALFARFEAKLEEYKGNLSRAAIELAKDWRLDKALRQLGGPDDRGRQGERVPHLRDRRRHRARRRHPGHRLGRALRPGRRPGADRATPTSSAREIAVEALQIAAGICVYTNDQITVEELVNGHPSARSFDPADRTDRTARPS